MFRSKTALGVAALAWALATSALSSAPTPAHAAEKTEKPAALDLESLKNQLASGKPDQILAALKTIADSKNPVGAPLVDSVLKAGGTAQILDEALKTAGKLKVASSSAAIAPYLRHREDDIRHEAARTLIRTGGPHAVAALRQGLRASDAMVRGVCATGLGTLGARDAIDDLFRAFDQGVGEAAASIGQLCTPEQCEKFAERTGVKPFDIMVTGFDQVLFRPPGEIPDEEKIRIVGRLRELGTPESGKFLADVAERWPKDWSAKVKQALDAAAKASTTGVTPGGGQ